MDPSPSALVRSLPFISAIPTHIHKEKGPYIRLKDCHRIRPSPLGRAGPVYTINAAGMEKAVMLQLKSSAHIRQEHLPGIHFAIGYAAQFSHPPGFVPGFLFTWVLNSDLLVVILPTLPSQSIRTFPSSYEELVGTYACVVYDLHGKHKGLPPANDFFPTSMAA